MVACPGRIRLSIAPCLLAALLLAGCRSQGSSSQVNDPQGAAGGPDPLRGCRASQSRSAGGGITMQWECKGGVLALAQRVAQPATEKVVSAVFTSFEGEMKPKFGERTDSDFVVDGKAHRSMKLVGLLPGGESLEVRQIIAAGSDPNTFDVFTCVAPDTQAATCTRILSRLVQDPPGPAAP